MSIAFFVLCPLRTKVCFSLQGGEKKKKGKGAKEAKNVSEVAVKGAAATKAGKDIEKAQELVRAATIGWAKLNTADSPGREIQLRFGKVNSLDHLFFFSQSTRKRVALKLLSCPWRRIMATRTSMWLLFRLDLVLDVRWR